MSKEAKARIRINKYLEDAGWRFFDTDAGAANICLETNVKITEQALNVPGGAYRNIREINPEISNQIEKIIDKCLQPEKEKRYHSVSELKEKLSDIS